MTKDEFRELLKESVRLEVTKDQWYEGDGIYIIVKLISTESNSSFDPKVILEDSVYLPART